MATGSFSSAPTNASDVAFRAWGLPIETALTVLGGLIKTADTGQIDWATVLAPVAINTKKGYIILRYDDTLQATAPVFIRIDFGSGTVIANPALWLTIGTGSDGSGNITNVIYAESQILSTSSASPQTSYYSVSTNRFLLYLWPPVSGCVMISLERSHGTDGLDTAEGLHILRYTGSGWKNKFIFMSGIATTEYSAVACGMAPFGSGISAPDVNAYVIRTYSPREMGPIKNILVNFIGDFAYNSVFSIACWDGVTRNYRSQYSVTYPTTLVNASGQQVTSLFLME